VQPSAEPRPALEEDDIVTPLARDLGSFETGWAGSDDHHSLPTARVRRAAFGLPSRPWVDGAHHVRTRAMERVAFVGRDAGADVGDAPGTCFRRPLGVG